MYDCSLTYPRCLSNCVLVQQSGALRTFLTKLHVEVVKRPREIGKLTIPAATYIVQNSLLFVALRHLDAATYSVCYQTKILTTALFSTLLLNKQLSPAKWSALILLAIGVALAKLSDWSADDMTVTPHPSQGKEREQSRLLGFVCVMAASFTSGFAGVYFEKVLKGSKTSLWIRNIQMGIPSIALAVVVVLYRDLGTIATSGFFFGYNARVAGVIFLQAMGGLVVAVVVRYADNIRKAFAAAVSIITSCIMSMLLFNFHPNRRFMLGVSCVCTAVYIYSRPPKERQLLPTSQPREVAESSLGERRRSYTHKV